MWLHQPVSSFLGDFPLPHRGCRQGEEESAAMVWDEQLWDGMASVDTEGQKPNFSFMKQPLLNTGNNSLA